MTIAILTDGVWPCVIGGMQKHSYSLCKYFARAGVKVHLYHTASDMHGSNGLTSVFEEKELSHITEFFIHYPRVTKVPGHYLVESYLYSRKIHNILSQQISVYDCIYIQGLCGWYTLKNKHLIKNMPPCILNLHGLEMFQPPASLKTWLQNLMFQPFVKKQLRQSDFVQSLGGKLTALLKKLGIPESRIIVCGIGIEDSWLLDKAETVSPQRLKTFTFLGRYERRKGISELTKAVKTTINKFDIQFHFIGPIPDDKKIEHERIFYYGLVQDESVIKGILDRTDFLLLPSYSEGMPTVILEAMARRCAIIATDVGAVAALVSDNNGILIQSPSELSMAIRIASKMSAEMITQKKNNSIKVVKSFRWSDIAIKMITQLSK